MVGILKSFDHLCFDRTIDTATSLFEFFVPESQEPLFLKVMDYFQKGGMVIELKKLPNRLIKEEVIL